MLKRLTTWRDTKGKCVAQKVIEAAICKILNRDDFIVSADWEYRYFQQEGKPDSARMDGKGWLASQTYFKTTIFLVEQKEHKLSPFVVSHGNISLISEKGQIEYKFTAEVKNDEKGWRIAVKEEKP